MEHKNTKQLKEAYRRYLRSSYHNLRQCYTSYSYYKQNAFTYCERLQAKYSNKNTLKIIGYNSMAFSVGFLGKINDKEAFFFITKDSDRYILIEEIEV